LNLVELKRNARPIHFTEVELELDSPPMNVEMPIKPSLKTVQLPPKKEASGPEYLEEGQPAVHFVSGPFA
jgi:hypothetical protein